MYCCSFWEKTMHKKSHGTSDNTTLWIFVSLNFWLIRSVYSILNFTNPWTSKKRIQIINICIYLNLRQIACRFFLRTSLIQPCFHPWAGKFEGSRPLPIRNLIIQNGHRDLKMASTPGFASRWNSYHALVYISPVLTYLLGTVSHVLRPWGSWRNVLAIAKNICFTGPVNLLFLGKMHGIFLSHGLHFDVAWYSPTGISKYTILAESQSWDTKRICK